MEKDSSVFLAVVLFPKVFKFSSGLRSGLLIAAGHVAVTFLSQILNSICAASFLACDRKVGCHCSVLWDAHFTFFKVHVQLDSTKVVSVCELVVATTFCFIYWNRCGMLYVCIPFTKRLWLSTKGGVLHFFIISYPWGYLPQFRGAETILLKQA